MIAIAWKSVCIAQFTLNSFLFTQLFHWWHVKLLALQAIIRVSVTEKCHPTCMVYSYLKFNITTEIYACLMDCARVLLSLYYACIYTGFQFWSSGKSSHS